MSQANSASATAETFQSASSLTYYFWQIPATTLVWFAFALVGVWLVWRNPLVGRRTLG
ncbi:MAG: hypothetical protein HC929_25140 [Leptolyngbyaceae cyanobacterium SM2_5_2]|nr:hypothetical protein [Leptolyngbyaceae cyanobacterium SM2_5_2]